MKNNSLPLKVGLLMFLFAILVSAAGYLAYRNLSLIVASIQLKTRPDLKLVMIKEISTDLDKAEGSVRVYRLTQQQEDIRPYYDIIGNIDEKIDSLRTASAEDTTLLHQIDTISSLIEDYMLVWNDMIDMYHNDSLDIYVRELVGKIAVETLKEQQDTTPRKSILKRVFSRKAIKEEEAQKALAREQAREETRQKIMRDLDLMEQRKILKDSLMLQKESRLAITGNEIRERLYLVIARMENEVTDSVKANSHAADLLAQKTYKWLTLFSVVASLLIIAVIMVVIRFVRKTREYQEALEQSKQETEKLAKTKELFLANMSHEIRTPVNAIYGFSEQLLHKHLDEDTHKMAGVIQSTSQHLVRIVNDLLDYSKLQNATVELEKTHFSLHVLLEDIRLLFLNDARSNHTALSVTIRENTPAFVYGDSHRLKQILLNLTGNAIKFTHNGNVEIQARAENRSGNSFDLCLTVKDSGIGISKEMQDKVFEEFTQAEAGTSRKFGGTGLGLSIVKKLVELHNGTIALESEPGRGTLITVRLPYNSGEENKSTVSLKTVPISAELRSLRILIVDDEEYNRMLFSTIFKRWQLRYDEAGDGYTAIEKIKTGKFNIVFMDNRMPGPDGLETVQYIRKELGFDADKLPVIATSATWSEEDKSGMLKSGMNAFLPKPFNEKMLLDTINSVIQQQSVNLMNQPEIKAVTNQSTALNLDNVYHLANNDVFFVKQLLESFIETTEMGISGLEEAVKNNNVQDIYEIAHKISAPCKHVGADFLYSNLKMIENMARSGDYSEDLVRLSDESSREFTVVKKELQKHLESL
jgi:signal transduction histidine kinase/CheY-like chemotaxis protein